MKTARGQEIKLELPVIDVAVNQGWGLNFVDFYTKLGMLGHNGIDYFTYRGCPVRASHDGIVTATGADGGGGIGIDLASSTRGLGYKTIYYHLLESHVRMGQEVLAGDIIAFADNTGIYTTGDHLHWGLKEIMNNITLARGNGYNGAIDPGPFLKKNWDKPAAYHRYGRPREYWPEYWFRFAPINIKNRWTEGGRYTHKTRKRLGFTNPLLSTAQANAVIYGGWGLPDVLNPSLYHVGWGFMKKTAYEGGARSFKR